MHSKKIFGLHGSHCNHVLDITNCSVTRQNGCSFLNVLVQIIMYYCTLLHTLGRLRVPAWFHSTRRSRSTWCLQAWAGHQSWPSQLERREASTNITRRFLGLGQTVPPQGGEWRQSLLCCIHPWNVLPGNCQHCNSWCPSCPICNVP